MLENFFRNLLNDIGTTREINKVKNILVDSNEWVQGKYHCEFITVIPFKGYEKDVYTQVRPEYYFKVTEIRKEKL